MLKRNIIMGSIAITLSHITNPVYSMEQTPERSVHPVTRFIDPYSLVPGQQWGSIIKKLEDAFGAGTLVFAGKAVAPETVIPNNILSENLVGLVFIENSKQSDSLTQAILVPSAETLEQQGMQLMGSDSENDLIRGSILMAFSQIKSAMEQNDWGTARRRFDRMENTAKADPIAQAMKFEIDRH